MQQLSLGSIARGLDHLLDQQMTGQARLAAQLVAAAESVGRSPEQVISILDSVVAGTVLDELWITDEKGHAYLTTVRGEDGKKVNFSFSPDAGVQAQASKFFQLLSEPVEANAVVTQEARNREIDWEIFKYVGVNGIDRQRIVQVGNALAFEEQGLLTDTYASPVMTAVLAAFGQDELLDAASTNRTSEVRIVFEAILLKQMAVNAILLATFAHVANGAGWSTEKSNEALKRISDNSPLDELYVSRHDGAVLLSNLDDAPDTLPRLDMIGPLNVGEVKIVEHGWELAGSRVKLAVSVYHPQSNCLAQVVEYIEDDQLVSPRYVVPMTF